MMPVYRGAVVSLVLAIMTVASILWQVRQSDMKAFATKSDIQRLATKADIAAINQQRQNEAGTRDETSTQRYHSIISKIDSVNRRGQKEKKPSK